MSYQTIERKKYSNLRFSGFVGLAVDIPDIFVRRVMYMALLTCSVAHDVYNSMLPENGYHSVTSNAKRIPPVTKSKCENSRPMIVEPI